MGIFTFVKNIFTTPDKKYTSPYELSYGFSIFHKNGCKEGHIFNFDNKPHSLMEEDLSNMIRNSLVASGCTDEKEIERQIDKNIKNNRSAYNIIYVVVENSDSPFMKILNVAMDIDDARQRVCVEIDKYNSALDEFGLGLLCYAKPHQGYYDWDETEPNVWENKGGDITKISIERMSLIDNYRNK